MRDTLLTQITSNLSGSSVKVSSELPWNNGGEVLYRKNMKHFYLDAEEETREEFIKTLDKNDVEQTTTTLTGYLTVDAKNQPSDISSVVANVIAANSIITASIDSSVNVENEIDDDHITYTFEFNFITIT
jgi:hypothetical protein